MENEIETVIQVMERTPGHRPPTFGAPNHCPRCGEWGMVDHTDHATSRNHCYLCGAEWTLTRRAVTAVTGNVTFIDADRILTDQSGVLYDAEPTPLRSRLAHPSATPVSTQPPSTEAPSDQHFSDQPRSDRRPRLRLAFSNGRPIQPVGA